MVKSGHVIVQTVLTAFVAVLPETLLGHVMKLIWVVALAMIAELGRRVIGVLWKEKK